MCVWIFLTNSMSLWNGTPVQLHTDTACWHCLTLYNTDSTTFQKQLKIHWCDGCKLIPNPARSRLSYRQPHEITHELCTLKTVMNIKWDGTFLCMIFWIISLFSALSQSILCDCLLSLRSYLTHFPFTNSSW